MSPEAIRKQYPQGYRRQRGTTQQEQQPYENMSNRSVATISHGIQQPRRTVASDHASPRDAAANGIQQAQLNSSQHKIAANGKQQPQVSGPTCVLLHGGELRFIKLLDDGADALHHGLDHKAAVLPAQRLGNVQSLFHRQRVIENGRPRHLDFKRAPHGFGEPCVGRRNRR